MVFARENGELSKSLLEDIRVQQHLLCANLGYGAALDEAEDVRVDHGVDEVVAKCASILLLV